ncbi:MAG: family 10 glycosylhydrolase [Planctomycetota bacterium]
MTHRPFRAAFAACLTACLLTLTACGPAKVADAPGVPEPPREFRAAWVATVANIDWPSASGIPTAQAKQELVAIFDRCVELNLNAVVLQVRPVGDALYKSELEPWSEFLTGASGKAPDEDWDPLAFAVEEAHARGLQLHAWFNPYRAEHPSGDSPLAETHLAVTRPDLVRRYGSHQWMDPGEPEVIEHSLNVVLDVVRRYDIDGIHLDDYFYPYPINDEDGNEVPFPDDKSYQAYVDAGGKLARNDWRRSNVDTFVQEMYKRTKAEKPHVLVGISPFGIYRPGYPEFIVGFDQYDKLYADARLWFHKGWLDYLTPQLYWPISRPDQSFTALLGWWVDNNPRKRHVWPGIATYRHFGANAAAYPANEFAYQVRWSRYLTDVSDGHVHFSMKWLMPEAEERGADMIQALRRVYAQPALIPATPWLSKGPGPAAPVSATCAIDGSEVVVLFEEDTAGENDALRVVQVGAGDDWSTAIAPASSDVVQARAPEGLDADELRVAVFTVDRFGQRSAIVEVGPSEEPAADTPEVAQADG